MKYIALAFAILLTGCASIPPLSERVKPIAEHACSSFTNEKEYAICYSSAYVRLIEAGAVYEATVDAAHMEAMGRMGAVGAYVGGTAGSGH